MAKRGGSKKTRIVVVGAGFGGVYAFKRLHKLFHGDDSVEISVVNPENYFLFTPLLHEVATGSIFPENVIEPIRKVMRCCLSNLYLGTVERVDTKRQRIHTTDAAIPYDYLLLASGATTNFFGTPGAEEHCRTLKSLEDAIALKNRFITLFERAANLPAGPERKRLLHTVIVGGGPTGVELATELVEFFETFEAYFNCRGLLKDARVTIVQKASALIPRFSLEMQRRSAEVVRKKGIELRLSTGVTGVRETDVSLDSGETLSAETVVWTAGVRPNDIAFDIEPERDGGRLVVDEFLAVKGLERVYAIGDLAAGLPMLAQVASSQGPHAATNIHREVLGKPRKPFRYRHRGNLVSLGQWMAIAEIGNRHFIGHFTWWVWRTIYLAKLISWQKKIQVAVDWTIDLFSPRDIARY